MIKVRLIFKNSSTIVCGDIDDVLSFLREFLVEAENNKLGFKAFFESLNE